VIARAFHRWERRLASVATNRVARPFEWGTDWLADQDLPAGDPRRLLQQWGERTIARSAEFYATEPAADYQLTGDTLTFTSTIVTPHPENNLVRARFFPDRSPRGRKRAVLVLPQWNSDAEGHVGLCRLLNRFGLSALRLSMPYHDARMPPELTRADYIVSANVGRTAQVCRQAVLDARRAIAWLHAEGYSSIGILGTSLGSCLSMLTTAHEPLIRRRLGWTVDDARAGNAGWQRHARRIAADVAADQSAALPRACARAEDSTGLCALRSDVPREPLAASRCRIQRAAHCARVAGAALRPLQHGRHAVQMDGWADAVPVPEQVPLEQVLMVPRAREGAKGAGERPHARLRQSGR
jgi:dienelactone hydrolase